MKNAVITTGIAAILFASLGCISNEYIPDRDLSLSKGGDRLHVVVAGVDLDAPGGAFYGLGWATEKDLQEDQLILLADKIQRKLLKLGCFQVIDRGDFKRVLAEQALTMSDLFNSTAQQKIVGNLLGADVLVLGKLRLRQWLWLIPPMWWYEVALEVKAVDVATAMVHWQGFTGGYKFLPVSSDMFLEKLVGIMEEGIKEHVIKGKVIPEGTQGFTLEPESPTDSGS